MNCSLLSTPGPEAAELGTSVGATLAVQSVIVALGDVVDSENQKFPQRLQYFSSGEYYHDWLLETKDWVNNTHGDFVVVFQLYRIHNNRMSMQFAYILEANSEGRS